MKIFYESICICKILEVLGCRKIYNILITLSKGRGDHHGTTIFYKIKVSIRKKKATIISLAERLDFLTARATVFRQGIVSLILASLGSLIGGIYLGSYSETLHLFPGLIIMIPAAIGMRGNIFASLGSRMSTALHVGEISRLGKSPLVTDNVSASLVLTLIVSCYLAILSRAAAAIFGFASISIIDLIVISVVGGFISSLLILSVTLLIAIQSFLRGWDPDNVTAPLITSVGDLVTLPCLFLAIQMLRWKYLIFTGILLACVICCVVLIRTRSPQVMKILKDSVFILMLSAVLSTGSGLVINARITQFISLSGLLILLPPFLEGGGALGGILSSRLSTSLHLGMIQPALNPPREVVEDFLVVALLGVTLFPSIGVLAFLASTLLHLEFPPLSSVILACLYAGLLIAAVVSFLSYYAAILSTRFGLDPDSVVIPMITGSMDFLGTNALILALLFLGIA
ncbi:MAG: magnesium transporter [Theionarchaea archaeon]|nr:magnesium transporter [Theionarchaea archaeon]